MTTSILEEVKGIKLIYDTRKNIENRLRIFGKYFVEKNKINCKIIYSNNTYDLVEYFENIVSDYKGENIIEVILIIIGYITNLSCMFKNCYSLYQL